VEQSLYFTENMFSVDESEVWKNCPKDSNGKPVGIDKVYQFIESHDAFKNGQVRRVASAREAASLTMGHHAMKREKEYKSEDVTVVPGGGK